MTEPRTSYGRRLLSFRGNHADWTEARWVEAIRAVEAEAAAGPREEHCCNDPAHMSAEYRASLDAQAAAVPRDEGLREAARAVVEWAHYYPNTGNASVPAGFMRTLERAIEAEAAAGPRDEGLRALFGRYIEAHGEPEEWSDDGGWCFKHLPTVSEVIVALAKASE